MLDRGLDELSKFLLWAERNDQDLFNSFFEMKGPSTLLNIIQADYEPLSISIIKFYSIMIENLTNPECLNKFFKDGGLNELILLPLQLDSDDLLAIYVSMLKNTSLRVDSKNCNLLYYAKRAEYPIFSKAIQFIGHEDPLVKTTVKSAILNLVKLNNTDLINDIIKKGNYFGVFLNLMVQDCQKYLSLGPNNFDEQSNALSNILDDFEYLDEYFKLQVADISDYLSAMALDVLFIGFLQPMISAKDKNNSKKVRNCN